MFRCPHWGKNRGPTRESELPESQAMLRKTPSGKPGGGGDSAPAARDICDESFRTPPQTGAAAGPGDYGSSSGLLLPLSDRSAEDTWPSSGRWFARESTTQASRTLRLRRAGQRDIARRPSAGTLEQT